MIYICVCINILNVKIVNKNIYNININIYIDPTSTYMQTATEVNNADEFRGSNPLNIWNLN